MIIVMATSTKEFKTTFMLMPMAMVTVMQVQLQWHAKHLKVMFQMLQDCNDGDASVNPAGTEVCNGIDDNCDGNIDEGVQSTFYADADGDGYGDAGSTTMACEAPEGYTADATDCNDADDICKSGRN
ncbi:MAG: putative metal-binding motif-containing protein [Bacteroidetes bacterium]|nr:putative metal-binding motif-containing protein [Bacteroidota bacterium]